MTTQPTAHTVPSAARRIAGKAPLYLSSIRIWESLFALPFAYMGMVLAAQGWPGWRAFIWITVAMFSVRTLGMFANRLVHRKEDAANPRTKDRHLPRGLLQPREVLVIMGVSAVVFLVAAFQLNRLAAILAPVAAAYVVLYSYAKYYTWGCNFILGWALAIAPAGAWIGVTGRLELPAVLLSFAVACWAGGFDIIYSCTDYDFDKQYGVHSVPRRFGIAGALWIARSLHLLAALALLGLGLWMGLGTLYYVGWTIAVALLVYENSLVKPRDLSRVGIAFFRVNSYISVQLLFFTILSLVEAVNPRVM
ncbi:MAG TPA: UbiA-like polyprenyltransferase [Dehalococcoidia bacterium]|nr:UbiA-like polyprenyltransferase [Dehalococcoidia bacterium]